MKKREEYYSEATQRDHSWSVCSSWQVSQRGISREEVFILIIILAYFVVIFPANLLKSRQAANEASAIGSVRTLGTAQATYQSTRGRGVDFAGSRGNALAELFDDGLLDSELARGKKYGYTFVCIGYMATLGLPSGFDTWAAPNSTGPFGTGERSFYSNETFVIYQKPGQALNNWGTEPPPGKRVPSYPALPLE